MQDETLARTRPQNRFSLRPVPFETQAQVVLEKCSRTLDVRDIESDIAELPVANHGYFAPSALMPACLITSAQRVMSSRMKASNPAGVLTIVSTPKPAKRSCTSGERMATTMSAFSLATSWRGVFAGTTSPFQPCGARGQQPFEKRSG